MADFYIGEDDRSPTIRATLEDETGPIDLTNATVAVKLRKAGADTLISGAGTVDVALTGSVSYAWVATDTQTPGKWWLQWQITFASGKKATVPNRGVDELWINEFWSGEVN